MSKYGAYKICQERGHVSNGVVTGTGMPWSLSWFTCKYCGTDYATETTTEVHERNAPKPTKGNDMLENSFNKHTDATSDASEEAKSL